METLKVHVSHNLVKKPDTNLSTYSNQVGLCFTYKYTPGRWTVNFQHGAILTQAIFAFLIYVFSESSHIHQLIYCTIVMYFPSAFRLFSFFCDFNPLQYHTIANFQTTTRLSFGIVLNKPKKLITFISMPLGKNCVEIYRRHNMKIRSDDNISRNTAEGNLGNNISNISSFSR